MPQLVVAILFLYVAFMFIVTVVIIIYSVLFLALASIFLVAEGMLGSIPGIGAPLSWGISGFMAGSVLYFAVFESSRLERPWVRPTLLAGLAGFFLVMLAL